jgi:hypothetical protein
MPYESEWSTIPAGIPTLAVSVEAFYRAIRDVVYKDSTSADQPIPSQASIQEVSCFFSLNRLQHCAFVLIAIPLLSKITNVPITSPQLQLFDSSPMIINGAGGTGKYQIVKAVRALAAAWNRPNCVMVVASTGIARRACKDPRCTAPLDWALIAQDCPSTLQLPAILYFDNGPQFFASLLTKYP